MQADIDTISFHYLPSGTELNKKYMVESVLGEGGFGITYSGRDKVLDMRVAIKEYYPAGFVNRNNTISLTIQEITGDNGKVFINGRKKILDEARILAKFCSEPGIVGVRDFFEENNTAYIVMDYLEGVSLKDHLEKNGIMSVGQTLKLFGPVLKSLEHIHAKGLIHRDISPENLMLTDGGLKLLDFGAARDSNGADQKTISVMLKPGYAPEEQYRSKGVQGPWTDVYALCATIYKCITGITPEDSLNRAFGDDLKTPSSLGIEITKEQEEALMRGMAILQKSRIQNINELRQRLYVEGNTNQKPINKPAKLFPQLPPNTKKRIYIAGAAVLCVLLLIALIAGISGKKSNKHIDETAENELEQDLTQDEQSESISQPAAQPASQSAPAANSAPATQPALTNDEINKYSPEWSEDVVGEAFIIINTNTITAVLTNYGGDMVFWRIKNGYETLMLETNPFTISYGGLNSGPVYNTFYVNKISEHSIEFFIDFIASNGTLFRTTKRWDFKPNGYMFELTVTMEAEATRGEPTVPDHNGYAYTLALGSEINPEQYLFFANGRRYNAASSNFIYNNPVWAAISGNSYVFIAIPKTSQYTAVFAEPSKFYETSSLRLNITRPAERRRMITDSYKFYLGPKSFENLNIYSTGKNDFGFIEPSLIEAAN